MDGVVGGLEITAKKRRQGGDQATFKVLGWFLGNFMEVLESATTVTGEDILIGSVELQEIKTTSISRGRAKLCTHGSHLHVLTQRKFHASNIDLYFIGLDEFVNKPVVENCKAKSSEEEPNVVRKNDYV
nr:hypothetical protein [Tanacetum cinerariifolium]